MTQMPRRVPKRSHDDSPPRLKPRRAAAPRTRFEISAGGVVYRQTRNGIAICLIATKDRTRWQLPKGKQEPGESLDETAAREVLEETGIKSRVGPRLEKIDLWFTSTEDGHVVRHHKLVYFYLLAYTGGTTRNHDHEVDDARWFDAAEARERLTFPSERRVLARALDILSKRSRSPRVPPPADGQRESPRRTGAPMTLRPPM